MREVITGLINSRTMRVPAIFRWTNRVEQNKIMYLYLQNNPRASFDIILVDATPAGRLYVDRKADKMRLSTLRYCPNSGRGG